MKERQFRCLITFNESRRYSFLVKAESFKKAYDLGLSEAIGCLSRSGGKGKWGLNNYTEEEIEERFSIHEEGMDLNHKDLVTFLNRI